jgi:GxxExxY protein
MPSAEPLTDRVIGLAIEMHRHTGPGPLESDYKQCLCRELGEMGSALARQVVIPIFIRAHRSAFDDTLCILCRGVVLFFSVNPVLSALPPC